MLTEIGFGSLTASGQEKHELAATDVRRQPKPRPSRAVRGTDGTRCVAPEVRVVCSQADRLSMPAILRMHRVFVLGHGCNPEGHIRFPGRLFSL